MKATEMILKHLEAVDKKKDESKDGEKGAAVKDEENFDDLTLFDVSKDEEDDSVNASSSSMPPSASGPPGPSGLSFNDDFGKLF